MMPDSVCQNERSGKCHTTYLHHIFPKFNSDPWIEVSLTSLSALQTIYHTFCVCGRIHLELEFVIVRFGSFDNLTSIGAIDVLALESQLYLHNPSHVESQTSFSNKQRCGSKHTANVTYQWGAPSFLVQVVLTVWPSFAPDPVKLVRSNICVFSFLAESACITRATIQSTSRGER